MKTKRIILTFLLLFSLFIVGAVLFLHTKTGADWVVTKVENLASSQGRIVRISNIEGLLSSEPKIGLVTIADRDGIWLTAKNIRMDWKRFALLKLHLAANTLEAEEIDIARKPLPGPTTTSDSSQFSLPKLPVSIAIDQLNIEKIHFGEDLFGIDSAVHVNGKISLASGNLHSELAVQRLDAPGNINLNGAYLDKTGAVDIDFHLTEPENGIVANLIKLDDRPPVDLLLKGNGTLDQLDLRLIMKAGNAEPVNGLFTLREGDDGRNFSTVINGPVAQFIPAAYRDYLGSRTALSAKGAFTKDGNIAVDAMTLKSGGINLAGQAKLLKDGFLRRLVLQGTVAGENGATLQLPGKNMSIRSLDVDVDYGNSAAWQGKIIANDLIMPTFNAGNFIINLSGVTENMDDAHKRHISVIANGGLNNISTPNAKIAESLNHKLTLALNADISAKTPLEINQFTIDANQFALIFKGRMHQMVFTGNLDLKADDLAPVALFAGMPLSGVVNANAKSIIRLKDGTFDLTLDGLARHIKTGNEKLNRLFAADMQLSGVISRDLTGFIARNFQLGNKDLALTANGRFGLQAANMDFALKLSDLSLLDDQSSGPLDIKGAARGDNHLIAVSLRANAPKNRLMTHKLDDAVVALNVLLDSTNQDGVSLTGNVNGSGSFANEPLVLLGNFAKSADSLRLDGVKAHIGNARFDGTIHRNEEGLLDGVFSFHAPDLSTFASLALMEGKGAFDTDIKLLPQNGVQTADITAKAENAEIAGIKIADLDVNGTVNDLFGKLLINGHINASDVHASGFTVHSLKGEARDDGGATIFQLAADMQDGLKTSATGSFSAMPDHQMKQLQLSSLVAFRGDTRVQLTTPAIISFSDKNIDIRNFNLDAAGGKLSFNGSVADTLDLILNVDQLPLRVANLIKTDLGAEGFLTGSIQLQGTKQNPGIMFDVAGKNLSVAQSRKLGLAAFMLNLKGVTEDKMVALTADFSGGGIHAAARGKLPMNTENKMDLDITLHDLPLKLANSFVDGQAISGAVTGTAKVGGTYLNPTAHFNFDGQDLSASVLARSRLSPIRLSAKGAFENKALTLQSMTLQGPQNLNLKASGHLPFTGSGLDFSIDGATPFSVANEFLAERGAKINSGAVTLSATLKGSLSQPLLSGAIKIANGDFIDTQTNLRLKDVNLDAVLRDDRVVINSFTANSSLSGSLSGNGNITVNAAQKFPTDLAVNFNSFRYNDGKMVTAVLSGKLTVTGALLQDPLIGGDITIENAEIVVPDDFAGAGMIDVTHKNVAKPIETTLERAGLVEKPSAVPVPTERPSVPQFKLRVRAPNQFFIRGFGLDVEMGGQIGIVGSAANIRPIGGLRMIRGRFLVLSQRVMFNEGQVTLVGNFDPQLYFVATTEGNDITVTITVSGTANALNIAFSSVPELPQDEILAQLLFGRSTSELSPFQLAQLASVAAQMAGLTNTSLLEALRSNTGLDDLDVTTDAAGNTGVKAGRYINEKVYLGVETGSGGSTKGTINLDITKSLKAKGAVGADGDSSVGVFYEKDY